MKTLRKRSGRLLGWLLTIVMVCGLLLSNGISVKAEGSIDNNGYPYGKNMSSSSITLICEATGAQQYQWQVSDAEEGTYTDINGATAAEYTFGPENLKWYRCMVGGTPSKAVQAVKPGEDGRTWTKYHCDSSDLSYWYLSNGKVAYFVCEDKFDIVGEYQKGSTTYMLCTSYNTYWQMYGGNSSSAPQKIHFSFDDLAVNVSVKLRSENGDFAFGCDTQLGNDNTSGNYSDQAALVAALNGDNTLKHIAMVGAAAVNDETDPNAPAFVIEPQGNPLFWIGLYYDRTVYAYNENENGGYTKSEVKKNDGGTESVVTIVQGTDSGMTMSWKGVSSVQFAFKVGTAKNTGAISGNVNYLDDSIDGLDPSTSYVIEVKDESGATVATYNILSDENGAIPFAGTDVSGTAFDLTGKSVSITKVSSTDTPANLNIAARPSPEDAEQTGDENYAKPQDVEENEVLTTENSITIHPKTEFKVKQSYRIFNADGTEIAGQDWVAVDENGDIVFSGLSEHTEYLIKAFVPATQTTPRSNESEGVKITTMGTIEVTNPTELSFVQDGLEHEFEITTTPADANKVYSLSPEESYTEEIVKLKDPGRYTVYYKASKDNYKTVYGSFDVEIREAALTDIVAVAKDYNGVYDGKAHSIEIEVVVPQTGAAVSYGTKDGEYTLTANPSYTDVGTYKVFYRVTAEGRDEKTGSADIIIEKADSTVTTAPAAKTLTYNGQAQELVTAGTATGGEMQYALGTATEATQPYTTSIPTATNAGTYYVWYKVKGNENHNDADPKVVTVKIATPSTYTVTVTNDGHGTGAANPASGVTGTEVTLTNTPAEGYQFKEWQVISGGVTVTDNKFLLGAANVEVKAIFEALPPDVYTVTVTNDGHGTGAANPASGVTGTEVTLTNTPAAGYKFKEWQVVSGGVTVADNKFTIGTANVEVKAIFEALPVYTVTVTNDGHGTGAANPASGVTGTEVTLTNTPAEGYQFKEWQVISGGVTVADNKFTIGTANVEIKAVFEALPEGSETGITQTVSGAPAITGSNMAEVVQSVVEAIQNGTLKDVPDNVKQAVSLPGAQVTLTLVSKPLADGDVPAADKTALNEAVQANGYDGYQPFDLSLLLTVTDPATGNKVSAEIHVSSKEVTFSLEVPENLRKQGRTFYLLHVSGGQVNELKSTTGNVLEGNSKDFSTYAIAYRDAAEPVKSTFYFRKVWEGSTEKSIDFTLYSADGKVVHQGFDKRILNAKEWSYSAVFKDAGSCYIIEKPIPGYITRYVNVGEYAGITDRCCNGGTIINKKIPKTGDETPLLLWTVMLLTGAAGLTVALTVNKRRKAHK